jgi:hypothetical protein
MSKAVTEAQRLKIIHLREVDKLDCKAIAERFKIAPNTVWKYVDDHKKQQTEK